MTGPQLLFVRGRLSDAFEEIEKRLRDEVEQVPQEHLLTADEDAWVEALAERYRVEAPTLRPDDMWMDEPAETKVDVSQMPMRAIFDRSRPFMYPGYRVVVHIPFDGDSEFFMLQPSSFTLNPPAAVVGPRQLRHVIEYPHDAPVDIDASTRELIGQVERYLTTARGDAEGFNARLPGVARAAIQVRRGRLEQHREHIAKSSIRIGQPGGKQQVIEDAITRRPAPVLPTATRGAPPIPLDPVLGDAVFEHILDIVRSVGIDMERAPEAFAGMDEEARRQVFITALNSHYRGKTTAEAFNLSGKTDILIRHEDRNLFIGECKFWGGPKAFGEAIDQLFGYRTWRDTKLCLIVFVRERNLTAIIEKGREALEAHAQFVDRKDAASETELRARVSWPGDERRHADLNVFFMQTPD